MAVSGLPDDQCLVLQADFNDPAVADRFWSNAWAWRGGIDVLVNNAAVMRLEGGIDDDIDVWRRVWDEATRVNMLASVNLMRAAVRDFVARGGGSIISISSWVVQRGTSNPASIAYAATKAAMTTATKTIARAYAKQGVLAYCIAPGVVRTRMS